MAIRVIKVPDIGEGIAEVELVAWHVQPGDTVAEDQPLADVMTDKANVEVPSSVAGRVVALGGQIGQMLPVGSELIRIETAGAAGVAPDAPPAAMPAPSPAARAPVPTPGAPAPVPAARPAAAAAPARATGAAAAPAATRPVAPPPVTTWPEAAAAPDAAPGPAEEAAPADDGGHRPLASPSVRRRARELDLDLAAVRGTGTGGRITHTDLEAEVAARTGGMRSEPVRAARRTDEQQIPVTGLRRRIAQQMQEAKRHIPHFSYVEELDVTEAEALRVELNARFAAARGKLTLLPLLMRAVVLAVREVPQVNARFNDETGVITRHGAVHLGIATQTPNGLVVPVVRHAEALDLWGMAAEVARLAEAARAGRATRAELGGSTLTISSLGALGGIVSTPIINRPEVAIVGVNRIVERPMMARGAVVPRLTMNLSSSFDHRVIDGMDAARFIQAVRGLVEQPALLFVG